MADRTDATLALAAAIAAWREAIGAEHVVTGGAALELVNRATFATVQRAAARVEPGDRDEAIACIRIAARFGVPLHPISAGRNWGYGSSVPPRDGAVVLSLARLARIVEYDEALAYVTVEPGVTFRRLAAFLRERGSRLRPPATGASPDASLVGNVLERGIGRALYDDMAAASCGYEVVLATGQVLHTGFAGLPRAAAGHVWATAAGPSLQGLFQQSSLGVVTRMTFWLAPAPALQQLALFRLRDASQLAAVVDGLRAPLLRDGPRIHVQLVNDYRLFTQTQRLDAPAALSRPALAEALGALVGGARFLGAATLSADDPDELAVRRRALATALARCADAGEAHLRFEPPAPPADDEAASLDGLRSAYFRKSTPMPADPHLDRDGCGVLWSAPVLPMRGDAVARAVDRIEAIVLAHGFEPSISLRPTGGRALRAIIGLLYDRDRGGIDGDARAAACHAALTEALHEDGLYPYRTGLQDLASLPRASDDSASVVAAIRRALDPQHLLSRAPGARERESDDAFDSPLRIHRRTEFGDLAFGAVALPPELAALRRELETTLYTVVGELPQPLAAEGAVLIARCSGSADFFASFYVPIWSFLHWLPARARPELDGETVRAARAAHALSLFLHLWDDHLSDHQLPVDLLRLHVRTLAWQRFTTESRRLCDRLGADAAIVDEHAAEYLAAVHAPEPVFDLDAYCGRFLRQVALWTLVPRLLGGDLREAIASFAVAWRLLDDVQDVDLDVAAGQDSAVFHALDEPGRERWILCRDRSRARGSLDEDGFAALSASIHGSGCLDRLLAEIDRRLRLAAGVATALDQGELAQELAGCAALARGSSPPR